MTTDKQKDSYYIGVLGKTLQVLDAFVQSQGRPLSLRELTQSTKLSKNTVFRILYTLVQHHYVSKDRNLYRLGARAVALGHTPVFRPDLLTVAGPHLDSLRERFGETVNLGVLDHGRVRYVDVRESREKIRLAESVGASDPVHSTALGKALLAYLPVEEARELLRRHGMAKLTDYTLTSWAALKDELESVRAKGYAVDSQESMLGAFCVAAPILNQLKLPVAAISISGPSVRFNESLLTTAAQALTRSVHDIERKMYG